MVICKKIKIKIRGGRGPYLGKVPVIPWNNRNIKLGRRISLLKIKLGILCKEDTSVSQL